MKIGAAVILFFFSSSVFAQFYETGQDPAKIKWRQINTPSFRLVYDSAFENQALKIASIFEYTSSLTGNTLHQKLDKVSIIIHNYSAESNGLVVWAPKRMEIYPVSPQNIYAQDWFEQLGVHEFRHVSQLSRINVGITGLGNIVIGQMSTGFSILFVHSWFLEGDAVTTETALTNTGRGREPSFEMETRAYMLDNHNPYPFKKAIMGSYKDYVPNYYQLGYLLVAYNRAKYGPRLWEEVLDATGQLSFLFFPFYIGLKSASGLSRTQLYNRTLHDFDSIWTYQSRQIQYIPFKTLNKRESLGYSSYRNPCLYNDSLIVVEKSGIDEIKKYVLINKNTGTEKVLLIPGLTMSDNLSIGGHYLVWEELIMDKRWQNCSYSVVRKYNLETGDIKYITKKSRYYAPAASPDGKKIAVVEADIHNQNSIVLLTLSEGQLIEKYCTPGNCSVQLPAWDDSSRYLVMTAVNQDGKSIMVLDTKTTLWETLLRPSYTNISQPKFAGNNILFETGLSGIDNIYAINKMSHKICQVTSVKNGAFDPCFSANNGTIIFSNYTSQGYDIAEAVLDSTNWIPIEKVKNVSLDLANKLSVQEPEKFDEKKIQYKTYPTEPYSKFGHLLNIHSWLPFYYNFTNLTNNNYDLLNLINNSNIVFPGYSVLSQNIQGTLIAMGGQGYTNRQLFSNLSLAYKALYPVFELDILNGGKPEYASNAVQNSGNFNSFDFNARTYIPFELSRGKYIQSVTPLLEATFNNEFYTIPNSKQEKSGISRYGFSLDAYRYYQMSVKDLFPRLGESVNFIFLNPLASQSDVAGKYWYLGSNFYFPGIFNHHVLKISFNFEKQDNKLIQVSSNLTPSRGYTDSWNSLIKNYSQISIASADYIFPIAYPDLQLLGFVYIKRFDGAFYFESTNSKLKNEQINSGSKTNFTSTGTEFTADLNFFYIPVPVNMGIRFAYKPSSKAWIREFVLNISNIF